MAQALHPDTNRRSSVRVANPGRVFIKCFLCVCSHLLGSYEEYQEAFFHVWQSNIQLSTVLKLHQALSFSLSSWCWTPPAHNSVKRTGLFSFFPTFIRLFSCKEDSTLKLQLRYKLSVMHFALLCRPQQSQWGEVMSHGAAGLELNR